MIIKKYEGNPILKPNKDNKWENLAVLNPAVVYDEVNKEFKMLYRAAGDDDEHYIYLGLATSKDGFNFTRYSNEPIVKPDVNGPDGGCIEDPRLFYLGGYYYLTYASRTFPPGKYWLSLAQGKKVYGYKPEFGPSYLRNNNSISYLAISKDLINWKKLGRVTDSRYDDRDVVIFYQKEKDRFVKISRPMEWCGEGYPCKVPSMWISYSDDMMEWGKPKLLYQPEYDWEDKKIGASTNVIETPYGYLLTYHGVSKKDNCYRVGALMLHKRHPARIIAKTSKPLMVPEYDYELEGFYDGCVFPVGLVVKEDTMYWYYGTADKYVCVATCSYSEFLDKLMLGEL